MLTNQDYIYSICKCYLFDGIEDEQLIDAIKLLNGRIKRSQRMTMLFNSAERCNMQDCC